MNFYKHHIGDYAKKTVHLSLLEHGAYLLMLHAYYGTEKPLPVEALYRITHAHTKAERAAVDSVAAQFWKKTDAGLVNGRAFEELESATELVSVARENGKRGGRPKITQRVSENNPVGFENGTQRVLKNKAIQTPDSTIQNPEGEGRSGPAPPVKAKRKSGRVPEDFTPDVSLALAELPDLDAEREVQKFRDWEFKTPRSDWPAVWRNWIESARETGKYAKRAESKIQWR